MGHNYCKSRKPRDGSFLLDLWKIEVNTPQISENEHNDGCYNLATNTVVLTNILGKVIIMMVNATFPLGAK